MDAVARIYLRQNVQRKSAEAEKTLEFIESQLPQLRQNLDRAEAQLNAFKMQKGSVDLSLETKGALDRAVDIEKSLTELSMKQEELRQLFTNNHPTLSALEGKRRQLLSDKAVLESKLKAVPEAELDAARLVRDAKTANELYFLLVNKAQELRVVKSGTIGNVRIIDTAIVPQEPVAPRSAPTLALALVLGLGAGIAAAFTRRALDHGVEDPEVVEHATGVPVYAGIPHSQRQQELVREAERRRSKVRPVLATQDPDDLAMEALRSLRTALQFSLLEARSNVIAIVGAAPSAGKSFVTVNLAHALAAMDKRVVVLDGDLRRGRLHNYFAGERAGGLSEVIVGELPLDAAVRKTQHPNVHYVASGALPKNPSELLASERFRVTLEQFSSRYDLVLVDTAPVLAVTDGALIGRLAGVSMLVLRAGAHPLREIVAAVKRFRQNGVQLHGAILNDVRATSATYGYSYHYQYEYRARD
jgi:tyrosine-protein kinase Etk/Wzc